MTNQRDGAEVRHDEVRHGSHVRHEQVQKFVRRFPWAHLGIGIGGNVSFALGAVLLLAQSRVAGLHTFLGGSVGMLLAAWAKPPRSTSATSGGCDRRGGD